MNAPGFEVAYGRSLTAIPAAQGDRGLDYSSAWSRRAFFRLGLTASGALVVLAGPWPRARAETETARLHPFVLIHPDNKVVIRFNRPEMGQGTMTSMPMIVAEELDADWRDVSVEWAPVEDAFLADALPYGVGGSGSVRTSIMHLRKIGAGLRFLFRRAAANYWKAPIGAVETSISHVEHNGERLPYARFLKDVASLQLPDDPPLKNASDFSIIGRRTPSRVTSSCIRGALTYGIDAGPDDCLVGAVIRPPVPMSKVKSFNADKATALPGVIKVVTLETNADETGVGVVADSYWTVQKARALIEIDWEWGPAKGESSESLSQKLAEALERPADLVPIEQKSLAEDLQSGDNIIRAEYEAPFQAHAALEPMTCTARVTASSCELWIPVQNAKFARARAAVLAGLREDQVAVHTQAMGGSFGRKYTSDYIRDAVGLAKLVDRPVKIIWSREDDMRHSPYRPNIRARLSAIVGEDGLIEGLESRLAGPSFRIFSPERLTALKKSDSFDGSTMEGLAPPFYPIARVRAAQHWHDAGIPVMWWRSVSNSFTAFFIECFIDELAAKAGVDPFDYRLAMLGREIAYPPRNLSHKDSDRPFDPARMARLLETLRSQDDGASDGRENVGAGLACHYSFETYVATLTRLRVEKNKAPRLEKVVSAVDCGLAINPNTIEQQVEGSIIFGATAALKSAITLRDGAVEQSNFHDFEVFRIADAPEIEVRIVKSDEPPGGMGEPGLPPIAPAIANAVFRATGKRVRKLPILAEDVWR